MDAAETYEIDPARLELGSWSQEFNTTVGEGDIAASYSADTIGLKNAVRTPFIFRGDLWISISLCGGNAKAYRLVHINDFKDAVATFAQRAGDRLDACCDPEGFYHGVTVSYRKDWFVLCGPPVHFVPGRVAQPGLFGG